MKVICSWTWRPVEWCVFVIVLVKRLFLGEEFPSSSGIQVSQCSTVRMSKFSCHKWSFMPFSINECRSSKTAALRWVSALFISLSWLRADNAATAKTLASHNMLTEGTTAACWLHRGTPTLTTGEEERRESEEKCAYAMIYIKKIGH